MSALRPRFVTVVMTAGLAVASGATLPPAPVSAATTGSLQARWLQRSRARCTLPRTAPALSASCDFLSVRRGEATYLGDLVGRAAFDRRRGSPRSDRRLCATGRRSATTRSRPTWALVSAARSTPYPRTASPDQIATGAEYAWAGHRRGASSSIAAPRERTSKSPSPPACETPSMPRPRPGGPAASLAATTESRSSALSAVNAERTTLSSVNGRSTSPSARPGRRKDRAQEAKAACGGRRGSSAGGRGGERCRQQQRLVVHPDQRHRRGERRTTDVDRRRAGHDGGGADEPRRGLRGDPAVRVGGRLLPQHRERVLRRLPVLRRDVAAARRHGPCEPGVRPATQDAAAFKLYELSGWGSWPECAAIAGL